MTAVHTSAHPPEADLFEGTPAAPRVDERPVLQLTGRLLHDAEVRSKPVGDGQHVRPVLCLDLAPCSGVFHTIHAEQIYTEATRKDAEARAATLKRGMRVTLTTPIADMRIFLPHVQGVAVIPSP